MLKSCGNGGGGGGGAAFNAISYTDSNSFNQNITDFDSTVTDIYWTVGAGGSTTCLGMNPGGAGQQVRVHVMNNAILTFQGGSGLASPPNGGFLVPSPVAMHADDTLLLMYDPNAVTTVGTGGWRVISGAVL
jgi:hypothetical protein